MTSFSSENRYVTCFHPARTNFFINFATGYPCCPYSIIFNTLLPFFVCVHCVIYINCELSTRHLQITFDTKKTVTRRDSKNDCLNQGDNCLYSNQTKKLNAKYNKDVNWRRIRRFRWININKIVKVVIKWILKMKLNLYLQKNVGRNPS